MVCVPCILLPFFLAIYLKFVQPYLLRLLPQSWQIWFNSILYPTCPARPPTTACASGSSQQPPSKAASPPPSSSSSSLHSEEFEYVHNNGSGSSILDEEEDEQGSEHANGNHREAIGPGKERSGRGGDFVAKSKDE